MASLEPEPAGDEPEPQPDDGSVPERAPIAAPRGDGPDMMQQLQMQQLERMQLAVEFQTTPACRSCGARYANDSGVDQEDLIELYGLVQECRAHLSGEGPAEAPPDAGFAAHAIKPDSDEEDE